MMTVSRFVVAIVVLGSSLLAVDAARAQGCTAARGCPTLPPPIPRSTAGAAPALANDFYASLYGPAASSSSTAPANAPATSVAPNKALIRVSVPVPDAVVSFQGVPSRQQGAQRLFASPALVPGRDYRYAVRCTWNDGEGPITREQYVVIRPGEETAVNFIVAR